MENPIKIEKALPRSKGGKEEGEEAEGPEASVETPEKVERPTPKPTTAAPRKSSGGGGGAKNARLTGVAAVPRKLPVMVTLYSQIPVGLMNWLNSRKC